MDKSSNLTNFATKERKLLAHHYQIQIKYLQNHFLFFINYNFINICNLAASGRIRYSKIFTKLYSVELFTICIDDNVLFMSNKTQKLECK